jgi:hypothetical protein
MSDFDAFDDSDHLPADHLLNELESIKDILDNNDDDGDAIDASLIDIPLLDIPLLETVVIDNLDTNAGLLNLNRIFSEGSEEESQEDLDDEHEFASAAPRAAITPRPDIPFQQFQLDTLLADDLPEPEAPIQPAFAPISSPTRSHLQKSPSAAGRVRPDYRREVLIQELVDEFVPQIEAALRERLSRLDNAALQQWKDSE